MYYNGVYMGEAKANSLTFSKTLTDNGIATIGYDVWSEAGWTFSKAVSPSGVTYTQRMLTKTLTSAESGTWHFYFI